MLVHGCLTCGGDEDPRVTCTVMYRAEGGAFRIAWVCSECVSVLAERLRDLTADDILCRNPELRERYLAGDMTWTGDYPAGLVPRQEDPTC